jgi:uncharacterized glyoxalase superfamily protein PhnB
MPSFGASEFREREPVSTGERFMSESESVVSTVAKPILCSAHPVLPVRDIEETAHYYRDVLGFNIHFMWREHEDAPLAHCGVGRNEAHLQFTTWTRQHDAVVNSGWVYVIVENIDALHEEVTARGAEIISPLETQSWQMREFEVKDCNGHILRFGQEVDCHEA